MKVHTSFFSRFLSTHTAGDSPPAYNSEEDEDYLPNVEGEGDWRGVSAFFYFPPFSLS